MTDHTRAPLLEAIAAAQRLQVTSFHMPGHKFDPGLLPDVAALWGAGVITGDLVECIPDIDYLHAPAGVLAEAQQLAAAAVGAAHTFIFVNGATAGNQAMLLATAADGETVIVPRAAHRSVYAGLILSGARPAYVPPSYHPEVGTPLAVEAQAVAHCLAAHPEAVAIHLTAPNYYGYVSDVAAIAALAHAHGRPLLVDEAHGAHFAFHPDLPASAVSAGADLVVQSPHKTLGALTQAAWLHLSGPRIDTPRLRHALGLLQSSSPSVLLTGSLDAARRLAVTPGRARLTRVLALAHAARTAIRAIPGLWCHGAELVGEHGIAGYDPTKLVIRVSAAGLSGTAFAAALWARFRLTVEFADPQHLICSITLADDEARVAGLLTALRAVAEAGAGPEDTPPPAAPPPPPLPEVVLTPREALSRPARPIPLAEAAGAVGAEQVIPYPPGIPLLMPGERITREMIDYLRFLLALKIKLVGPQDPALRTVRILEAA